MVEGGSQYRGNPLIRPLPETLFTHLGERGLDGVGATGTGGGGSGRGGAGAGVGGVGPPEGPDLPTCVGSGEALYVRPRTDTRRRVPPLDPRVSLGLRGLPLTPTATTPARPPAVPRVATTCVPPFVTNVRWTSGRTTSDLRDPCPCAGARRNSPTSTPTPPSPIERDIRPPLRVRGTTVYRGDSPGSERTGCKK